jgi:hypothetical protein
VRQDLELVPPLDVTFADCQLAELGSGVRTSRGSGRLLGLPRWRVSPARVQKCLPIPACFSTALAVWRDLISPSTTKLRSVRGLNQISWSPLPCRSNRQPWARSSFLSSGVNEELIQDAR